MWQVVVMVGGGGGRGDGKYCSSCAKTQKRTPQVVRVHDECERNPVVRHVLEVVLSPHLPENQNRNRLHGS